MQKLLRSSLTHRAQFFLETPVVHVYKEGVLKSGSSMLISILKFCLLHIAGDEERHWVFQNIDSHVNRTLKIRIMLLTSSLFVTKTDLKFFYF